MSKSRSRKWTSQDLNPGPEAMPANTMMSLSCYQGYEWHQKETLDSCAVQMSGHLSHCSLITTNLWRPFVPWGTQPAEWLFAVELSVQGFIPITKVTKAIWEGHWGRNPHLFPKKPVPRLTNGGGTVCMAAPNQDMQLPRLPMQIGRTEAPRPAHSHAQNVAGLASTQKPMGHTGHEQAPL